MNASCVPMSGFGAVSAQTSPLIGLKTSIKTIAAGVLALPDNAFEAQLTGVREHERAVLPVEVLIEAQARRGTREEARERGLSHCERVAPQVG